MKELKRSIKEEYKSLMIEDMINYSKQDIQHFQQSLQEKFFENEKVGPRKVSVTKKYKRRAFLKKYYIGKQ